MGIRETQPVLRRSCVYIVNAIGLIVLLFFWTIGCSGGGGNSGSSSGGAVSDTTSPSVPTGLTAVVRSSVQIALSWTASTDNVGVTGYGVYQSGSLMESVISVSTRVTDLSPGTEFCYTVKAFDAAGNESVESNEVCASTLTSSTWYRDADGDGYSDGLTQESGMQPIGYYIALDLTAASGDCNDNETSVNPGALEICGDGIDQDCSGVDLSCTPDTVYALDDFEDGAGGFFELSNFFVSDGRYVYSGLSSEFGYYTVWNGGGNPSDNNLDPQLGHSDYFNDFHVSIETNWHDGSEDSLYGLTTCWREGWPGRYDHIDFLISKTGTYGVFKSLNGEFEVLGNGRTYLTAIDGQSNTISVEKKGSQFRFYINDVKVEDMEIGAPTGGGIGVYGGELLEVGLDNFRITEPFKEELVPGSQGYLDEQKRLVNKVMTSTYLWYDRVPEVNLDSYDSPEALLEALRYPDLDKWSYVTTKEEYQNLFEEGKYIGVGVGIEYDYLGQVRIRFAYKDSPADLMELVRGDRILEINGKTIPEINTDDLWEDIFGEDEIGVSVDVKIETSAGLIRDLHLEKAWVTIDTVLYHDIIQAEDMKIGYLVFNQFLEPSRDELLTIFQEFHEEGIDELILDLRYNSGGRINIANLLGGLIGGQSVAGKVSGKIEHNDKYSVWDSEVIFETPENPLHLERLTTITTGASCSASEQLMNALKPFMEVTSVGSATCGKPVGMYGYDLFDKHISPIEFKIVNAEDEGDYFDGIPAACYSDDDLTRQFGELEEDSLKEALNYVTKGSCTSRKKTRSILQRETVPMNGFRREIGAF